jgi:hypothetical protein
MLNVDKILWIINYISLYLALSLRYFFFATPFTASSSSGEINGVYCQGKK